MTEDGRHIAISTLGTRVTVSIPDCEISPALENWHALVLLHYIANADGTLPAGEWMSFADMKDGLVRGTKYAASSDRWLEGFLKDKEPEKVGISCRKLGGEEIKGRGDFNVMLPFLPCFPVLVSLWEADEDFAACGKILIDRHADHYLTIEDAVTVGEIIQKRIEAAWGIWSNA